LLLKLKSDLFCDGLDLARIRPRANYEIVGEGSDLAHIQYANVSSLLRFCGSDCREPWRGISLRGGSFRI